MKIKNYKGISMSDAPSIVMIVGFVFLLMATIAYVGEKYGDAMPLTTYTITNESTTKAIVNTDGGFYVTQITQCEFEGLIVANIHNSSGGELVPTSNYTVASTGLITFAGTANDGTNNSDWNVSYNYDRAGAACNVTRDLNTNLSDNTDMAGILLTIGLVGIILGVLIGVFAGFRGRGM